MSYQVLVTPPSSLTPMSRPRDKIYMSADLSAPVTPKDLPRLNLENPYESVENER